MDIDQIKKHAHRIANIVKSAEELDPNAVILPTIERSLHLDFYSCGVQSTYVILKYFRKRISLTKLDRELQTDWTGTEAADTKRVLKRYGLKCDVERAAKLRDIRKAINGGCPVLVTMYEGAHWSVVYGYSKTHVYVVDSWIPSNVWCRVAKEKFREEWDKWVMVVKK
jgi:ABC-type bacteriocin/lantibiotic exporter with double-glycine peptidase domain